MTENSTKNSTKLERRSDWEANHAVIQQTYIKLLYDNKRAPTLQEVADQCNLSRQSVWKHCRDLELDYFRPSAKLHANAVLLGLIKNAIENGNAAEAKLFFQLVFGWKEKVDIDPTQLNINEIKVVIMQGKNDKSNGES